jgi:eukaryotic-like serine/threonine-protein kinase
VHPVAIARRYHQNMPAEAAPRQIGRYEIVGRLAVGGMAEVLLGRLRGPHGFERPVVIKRILPHLALQRSMVELFLDEARIIANLRHPNLINVHELGDESGEYFMAMEFIAGESLSGLCRRLARRHEQLDLNLAAHIIAEACAGLHAAHTATSPDGRPLEIVHRDVSPQNILVTYSGGVQVIDFGIATTVNRISRTEACTVRGKFEYLSPEQLNSLPLDRRTDIFALGIVLLELASGRRVYRRESHAQTLMAILHDAVPRLTALRPDASVKLEEICSRALAKHRAERYQTAAEMRRDLIAFIRERTIDDLAERLGKVLHEIFPDRVAEKADMLQRVRQGSDVETLPAAEVDVDVDLPTAAADNTMATELSQAIPVDVAVTTTPRRRRLVSVFGIGAVIIIVAASTGWTRVSRTAAGRDRVDTVGVSTPIASAASADQRSIHIQVQSSPSGATVVLGHEARGTTPLDLPLPRGIDSIGLEISLAGFEPTERFVVPTDDQTLLVELAPRHHATQARDGGTMTGRPPSTRRPAGAPAGPQPPIRPPSPAPTIW